MKTAEIYPGNLLLPGVADCAAPMLRQSIAVHGILAPVVLCQGLVIDGHQRLLCAKETGIEMVPTIQVEGEPEALYIELNRHRAFSNTEIVGLIRRAKKCPEKKLDITSLLNLSSSPQLIRVLEFLAGSNSLTNSQINTLPINVWRELGHLQTELLPVALWLTNLSATAAEKRLIAGLLRQADRRKALPEKFEFETGPAAIAWLNEIVQPRRSQALAKIAPLLEKGRIPSGISIKFDQTFEKPGLEVMINASRKHLDRFDKAKELVQEIFTQVEEL
jgi:hypothetical protein